MKKNIKLIAIIPLILVCTIFANAILIEAQFTEAATVSTSITPFEIERSSYASTGFFWVFSNWKRSITATLQKNFDLVHVNGFLSPASFNLEIGKSVTAQEGNTTGKWTSPKGRVISPEGMADGGTWGRYGPPYLSDVIDGSLGGSRRGVILETVSCLGPYNCGIHDKGRYYALLGFSLPQETKRATLTSSNSSLVRCSSGACTAVAPGTATITVNFPDSIQSSSFGFLGSNMGYGYVNHSKKIDDASGPLVIKVSPNRAHAYSFPPITYTITVPQKANTPHVVSCSGVNNVTASGAQVNWGYSDADNDKQTNYQVQISTTANFSNIVKSITAPANTDVSTVRSAIVTGLSPNTTYYARVRAYNANNQWSDYTNCAGSFKTLDTPVHGMCHATQPEVCTQGTYVDKTDTASAYLWSCEGINGGTTDSCSIPKDTNQTSSLSVSCSAPGIQPGGTATFTATALGNSGSVTYDWLEQENGVPVKSGSSNTYSKSYSNIGSYKVWIRASDSVKSEKDFCSVTVGCNTDHFEGKKTACDASGFQDVYSCTQSGWTTTSVPCGGGGDEPTATFSFDPWIVPNVNTKCGLNLNATNVTSCSLVPSSTNSQIISIEAIDNIIDLKKDRRVPVGKHTLSCTGTNGVTKPFGTKSCILNPEVREF